MRRLALLLLGSLILTACNTISPAPVAPARGSLSSTTESTVKPTHPPAEAQTAPTESLATAEPAATAEPPAGLDGLIDDFSDPASGWDSRSGAEGSVGYENGEYVIQVNEADYSLWANPGAVFGDVLIGVTARPTADSAPTDLGAICRYQDAGNFIYGEITSDGFYGISHMKNGDLKMLTGGGALRRSDAIREGTQANRVQLLCAGNRFALVVNDQVVAEIEANASASGDVGLIAGTFEKGGAQVRFDDFSAVVPSDSDVSELLRGGSVLLADNFSDPASGWEVRETANGATGYRDNCYFIRIKSPTFQLWSSPDRFFAGDVVVEATARVADGPEKNEMGVICRYQDKQNFVYSSVGADGYYAIIEVKDNQSRFLTGDGKFQRSTAIPTGDETYTIRLACEGDRYTLFVNDQEIDSAQSSAFTAGDVGLLAGAFDQGGVEILFDNFSVSKP
jgi:hypothetical protein